MGIDLIVRWRRRPHCGKQSPRKMVFSCKRRLAKHDEPAKEPAANSPPLFCFCSCSDFPQWWTVTRNCKPNDPFPTTYYFWLEYFYHRTERKLEQKYLPEREDVTMIDPAMWPWVVGFFVWGTWIYFEIWAKKAIKYSKLNGPFCGSLEDSNTLWVIWAWLVRLQREPRNRARSHLFETFT